MNLEPILPLIEAVKTLPPAPEPPPHPVITDVRCACDKKVPISSLRPFHTGKINAMDNVCKGCEHFTKGMSILVCYNCATVVARMPAHKTQKGFQFEAGKSYHLTCCGMCNPEGAQKGDSVIAELAVFNKTIGYKQ